MEKTLNFKAFNFSPIFWWKAIEKSIELTDLFGKEIESDFNFINWFNKANIENDTVELIKDVSSSVNNEQYYKATRNEYFHKIIGINIYGREVSERTEIELFKKHDIDETKSLKYNFNIYDLNHLAFVHFHKWLIFDNFHDWVKWQLYFDFIVSKIETPKKELYIYLWKLIFSEIDFRDNLFENISQYKKFRDKLHEFSEDSKFVEEKIRELRKKKKL
ncbi:hypothetical protein [Gelidibacter salicanalis]|uniref:Uncharacterized protein n=1 Tax=Gelidibacter salicanalis TaxID=291193 RepID=A0A934NKB0_9FLAO|nr:hypothetical protein [Gelidibacter salicanalis]MBJ7883079.1 hypothetical protein [Gelidibacter salicanalis]